MSAPASIHAEARESARAAVVAEFFHRTTDEQRRTLVRAFVDLLLVTHAGLSAENNESAGLCRPPRAGVQPTTHEDRASALQERDAAFEEDDRSDCVTSIDI